MQVLFCNKSYQKVCVLVLYLVSMIIHTCNLYAGELISWSTLQGRDMSVMLFQIDCCFFQKLVQSRPAWGPHCLGGMDVHKSVSSQQWDFLCWWDVIFTLSRAPDAAILVIRNESCDVHYFLYVHLSLMLPNKFLSSERKRQSLYQRLFFKEIRWYSIDLAHKGSKTT